VLEGLGALVDQSLVQPRVTASVRTTDTADMPGEGEVEEAEVRFRQLYVIREYALDRLETSDGGREAEALRRAHAVYYLALVERAEPELSGPDASMWLERLEHEHDNLRAALRWAEEQGAAEVGLRIAVAVGRFWLMRGYHEEGRAWVDRLLGLLGPVDPGPSPRIGACPSAPGCEGVASGPDAGRAVEPDDRERERADDRTALASGVHTRALITAGRLALFCGEYAMAVLRLEAAIAAARAAGDLKTAGDALLYRGVAAQSQHEDGQAERWYAESLALARAAASLPGILAATARLGLLAYEHGDLALAAARWEEAIVVARQVSDYEFLSVLLLHQGRLALHGGDAARARNLWREALARFRILGALVRVAGTLELLMIVEAARLGVRAARVLGAAAALRDQVHVPHPPWDRALTERVAAVQATVGGEAWAAAFAAGRSLSLEEAIAEVLGEDKSTMV
jgi:hypothetical protein